MRPIVLLNPILLSTALVSACVDTATDAPALDETTGALVNAPRDATHTWSVGVCAGALNTDPAFGPIGACRSRNCTGTLIAPNLVLTARHCVRQIDFGTATDFCDGVFTDAPLTANPPRVTVSASSRVGDGTTPPAWLDVAAVLVPATSNLCDDDLAVLVLAQPVPATAATPAALRLTALPGHAPGRVALVGRGGLTDLIDPVTLTPIDAVNGDFYRRVKEQVPFRCVSNTDGACSIQDITSTGGTFYLSSGQFLLGAGTAPGDSGTGVVDQKYFTLGAPLLVGVVTANTYDTAGVGNGTLGNRLDRHAAFLQSAAATGAAAGSYPVPPWACGN